MRSKRFNFGAVLWEIFEKLKLKKKPNLSFSVFFFVSFDFYEIIPIFLKKLRYLFYLLHLIESDLWCFILAIILLLFSHLFWSFIVYIAAVLFVVYEFLIQFLPYFKRKLHSRQFEVALLFFEAKIPLASYNFFFSVKYEILKSWSEM